MITWRALEIMSSIVARTKLTIMENQKKLINRNIFCSARMLIHSRNRNIIRSLLLKHYTQIIKLLIIQPPIMGNLE
jgi:hypothetical protein